MIAILFVFALPLIVLGVLIECEYRALWKPGRRVGDRAPGGGVWR